MIRRIRHQRQWTLFPSCFSPFYSPSFRKIVFHRRRRPSHEMKNSAGKMKIERGWTWPQINHLGNKMRTLCLATGLDNGHREKEKSHNPFRKNGIRPLTLLAPRMGKIHLRKFRRIFRSPAYLLRFYDRKAMEILNLFSIFQLIYVDPRFPLPPHPLPSLDTSSFSDAEENEHLPIWNIFFSHQHSRRVISLLAYWNIFREGGFWLLCCAKISLFTTTCSHPTTSSNIHWAMEKIVFDTRFSVFNIHPHIFWKWFQVFYHSVFSLLLSSVQNCEIYFFPFGCNVKNVRWGRGKEKSKKSKMY